MCGLGISGKRAAMSQHIEIAAFILAGGANSRMGRNKALIKFAGEPLILHTARLLEPRVSSVTVIGPAEPFRKLGLHTMPDEIRGEPKVAAHQGPLAGIVTALGMTPARWNLILACDLPYLTGEWIDKLLSRVLKSSALACVPRAPGGLEPLAAVYRREAYAPLAEAFRKGVRKITDALATISLETIEMEELGGPEHGGLVLRNMNTPQDFKAAKRWWRAGKLQATGGLKRLKAPWPKRSAPRRNK